MKKVIYALLMVLMFGGCVSTEVYKLKYNNNGQTLPH